MSIIIKIFYRRLYRRGNGNTMKFTKILALCLAAVFVLAMLAACADTSYVMTVGEKKYPVGPFAFYAYLTRDTYDMQYYYYYNTRLTDVLNTELSDGTKVYQTVNQYVEDQYLNHIVISEKFEELGLSLTEEQKAEIEANYKAGYVEQYGADLTTILETLQLTEEEMKDMIALSYKSEAIVNHYFGEGGQYEVLDSEMRSYFTENYARFKYVILDKKDEDGNTLTTDKLLAQYDKAKAALAALEAGRAIEDVIVEYSDDYVTENELPADAKDEDKATAEAQNKTMTVDGVITDKAGIFDETYYSYYGSTLDSEIVNWVFAAEIGEFELKELDGAYMVIQKFDVTENEEHYQARKSSVFSAITESQRSTLFSQWMGELSYTFNENARNLYDVRGLEPLFISFDE